jgi:phage baseplate assembly protein W
MIRRDLAFPFRIAPGSSQGAEAPYGDHVDQLLRQLLLTSPGERVCLPEFGCGLRRLVFAPQSEALVASVKLQVRQAIERWLADQVRLTDVQVLSGATDPSSGVEEGELLVLVSYVVVDSLTPRELELRVR